MAPFVSKVEHKWNESKFGRSKKKGHENEALENNNSHGNKIIRTKKKRIWQFISTSLCCLKGGQQA